MQSEYMCLGQNEKGASGIHLENKIEETIIRDYRLSSKIYNFSGMILVVGIKWHFECYCYFE